MNISLRRARRLEMALRGVSVSGQVASIRTYDTGIARKDLDSAIDALQGNIEDAVELNEIRYHIRHQINLKNVECGISALLNNKDLLHDEKEHYDYVVGQLRDITQKLNEISDTLYQLNNDVSIELDEEDIELLRSKGLL